MPTPLQVSHRHLGSHLYLTLAQTDLFAARAAVEVCCKQRGSERLLSWWALQCVRTGGARV